MGSSSQGNLSGVQKEKKMCIVGDIFAPVTPYYCFFETLSATETSTGEVKTGARHRLSRRIQLLLFFPRA